MTTFIYDVGDNNKQNPKRRIEKMLFEDMKKFYMTIGFLDEFNNRGFSVS